MILSGRRRVPHSSRGDTVSETQGKNMRVGWGIKKSGEAGGVGSSWMCRQGRAYCNLNVMQKEVILYVVGVREDHCWTDL